MEHSILAGQKVQVLKYIPNKNKMTSDLASDLDFYVNEYRKLELKSFDTISINIMDVSGATIDCDQRFPTRLQLMFVNTNSF